MPFFNGIPCQVKGDEYDELREKVVAYKDRKGVASATGAATAQATPSLQREASDTPLPPPADALPTGWRSNIDPKSGKEYYYNKVLNVTQWTRPVVCYPDKSRAPPPVLTSTSSAPSQANKPKQAAARGGGQSEKAPVAAQLSADDVEMYDSLKKELENLTANVRDRMRLCKGVCVVCVCGVRVYALSMSSASVVPSIRPLRDCVCGVCVWCVCVCVCGVCVCVCVCVHTHTHLRIPLAPCGL